MKGRRLKTKSEQKAEGGRGYGAGRETFAIEASQAFEVSTGF